MQQDCKHCQELLWSYLAKELSESESKLIEAHLRDCPSCRADAVALAPVVSSLREEIPMPATFSAELHKKLTLAAEEMAAEPSSGKGFMEKLKTLPRSPFFRTLAPALVCLVLVVGVFSSGLFDTWNNADQILIDPAEKSPVVTQPPAPTKAPSPEVTPEPLVPADEPTPPAKPRSSNSSTPQPEPSNTESLPTPTVAVPETAPATIADAPTPVDIGDTPAPASISPEEPSTGFALPRHLPTVTFLHVEDTEQFLNSWQEQFEYDWKSAIQSVPPDGVPVGDCPSITILKLDMDAFQNMIAYADSMEEPPDTQGETLLIFTEDEE